MALRGGGGAVASGGTHRELLLHGRHLLVRIRLRQLLNVVVEIARRDLRVAADDDKSTHDDVIAADMHAENVTIVSIDQALSYVTSERSTW